MKAFLDSSVLVPVFYGDHQHHAASLDLFTRFPREQASCAAHSLLEVYATLTRMPGKHRISGEQAMLFINDIRARLTLVSLDAGEYGAMLEKFVFLGVTGGTIYDALLAACAIKAEAKALFSWNVRHYQQFGPEVAGILKTP